MALGQHLFPIMSLKTTCREREECDGKSSSDFSVYGCQYNMRVHKVYWWILFTRMRVLMSIRTECNIVV